MANAKICDRCGNVYGKNTYQESFNENAWGTVRGACVTFEETDKFRKSEPLAKYKSSSDEARPERKNHYVDLCDECAKQLCLFLRDKDAQIVTSNKVRF